MKRKKSCERCCLRGGEVCWSRCATQPGCPFAPRTGNEGRGEAFPAQTLLPPGMTILLLAPRLDPSPSSPFPIGKPGAHQERGCKVPIPIQCAPGASRSHEQALPWCCCCLLLLDQRSHSSPVHQARRKVLTSHKNHQQARGTGVLFVCTRVEAKGANSSHKRKEKKKRGGKNNKKKKKERASVLAVQKEESRYMA